MKKQKKAWTLNTVFKVTRRCSIVFAAWVFFWCVVVLFSPETVKYIGVGEQIDDLMRFQPREFVEALI